jgi:hypothetical protein
MTLDNKETTINYIFIFSRVASFLKRMILSRIKIKNLRHIELILDRLFFQTIKY